MHLADAYLEAWSSWARLVSNLLTLSEHDAQEGVHKCLIWLARSVMAHVLRPKHWKNMTIASTAALNNRTVFAAIVLLVGMALLSIPTALSSTVFQYNFERGPSIASLVDSDPMVLTGQPFTRTMAKSGSLVSGQLRYAPLFYANNVRVIGAGELPGRSQQHVSPGFCHF